MSTLDKLNPDNVLIVLADLQPPILAAANKTNPEANLKRAVSVLTEGAKVLDIPIFTSAVPLQPDTAPALIDELSSQTIVVRTTPGVFDDVASQQTIANHKRSVIAIGGVASELAVLQTALGARRLGYDVYLLTDVSGGLSDRTEQAAFRQLEAAGVTLSSVAGFLSSLIPPPEDPRGQSIFAALARFFG
ncbi:isochorismatase family protein [Aquirhabdus parva]|uniref:Isochorismatase family protein n=1 Tax=Aquirhabdus parva TaxID=2283318 RepID=A0A345P9I7_9GAMM|nr:isochorismatase family protein [Aquirhabdus parva]AXI03946.1 isochorismatase family protein [Aquirhabdus parva]